MFRQEVIEAQQTSQHGETLKIRPLKFADYTIAITVIVISISVVVSFFQYTRKETVHGILSPTAGATEISAPISGTVTNIVRAEGDIVKAGDVILTISKINALSTGEIAGELVIQELQKQALWHEQQLVLTRKIAKDELSQLQQTQTSTAKKLKISMSQRSVIEDQYNACAKMLDSFGGLLEKNVVSEKEYLFEKVKCLEIKKDLNQNLEAVLELESELESTSRLIKSHNDRLIANMISIRREISENALRLSQLESETSVGLISPIEGKIISLRAKLGDAITLGQSIAILAKDQYLLEAFIYIPTRASAFIKKGQKVNLKYDAYPHQRYGWGTGHIVEISETTFSGDLVPDHIRSNDYYYRAKVEIETQYVNERSPQLPLINGMTVVADIPYDTRYLWQWMTSSDL